MKIVVAIVPCLIVFKLFPGVQLKQRCTIAHPLRLHKLRAPCATSLITNSNGALVIKGKLEFENKRTVNVKGNLQANLLKFVMHTIY